MMAKAERDLGFGACGARGNDPPSVFSPERLLESLSEAVLACDLEGEIQYLNAAARRQIAFGLLPPAEELGAELLLRLGALPSAGAVGWPAAETSAQGTTTIHVVPAGEQRALEFVANPIRAANGQLVGFVFSIAASRRQRADTLRRLLHEASHDELTGLVNRRELIKRLKRVCCLPFTGQHALFFMDLDKFKQVNDTCGHRAGDEALRQVAMLLRSKLRKRDTLGRLGGDEFVLLMEHCPQRKAIQTAHGLSSAMRDFSVEWGGQRLQLGISIGIVPVYGAASDPEQLLAEAESACYKAKRTRGIDVAIYRQEDTLRANVG